MTDTSLPVVNINDEIDRRVNAYFEQFFLSKVKITENDYELIKSFCIARTQSETAAAALSAAIINVVNELDLYAPDVIEQFANSNPKATIPLFLNLSRQGVSLLGYVNDKVVPPRVKQQILT
tara:strand:- start:6420 stop:6785 length:366 start_codon:yes stop_codon:yes gene_type:complete